MKKNIRFSKEDTLDELVAKLQKVYGVSRYEAEMAILKWAIAEGRKLMNQ